MLSGNKVGKLLFTLVCLCDQQYNLVTAKGRRRSAAGKGGITSAMHHRLSDLSTCRLKGLEREMSPDYDDDDDDERMYFNVA